MYVALFGEENFVLRIMSNIFNYFIHAGGTNTSETHQTIQTVYIIFRYEPVINSVTNCSWFLELALQSWANMHIDSCMGALRGHACNIRRRNDSKPARGVFENVMKPLENILRIKQSPPDISRAYIDANVKLLPSTSACLQRSTARLP